jgi:hypothetical protein
MAKESSAGATGTAESGTASSLPSATTPTRQEVVAADEALQKNDDARRGKIQDLEAQALIDRDKAWAENAAKVKAATDFLPESKVHVEPI